MDVEALDEALRRRPIRPPLLSYDHVTESKNDCFFHRLPIIWPSVHEIVIITGRALSRVGTLPKRGAAQLKGEGLVYYAPRKIDLSQRVIGASVAVAAFVGLGVALASMNLSAGPVQPERITELILLEPPKPPPPPPKPEPKPEVQKEAVPEKLDLPPPEPMPEIENVLPAENAIVAPPPVEAPPAPPAVDPGPPIADTAPVIKARELPRYPEQSRQAKEEGTTALNYCVSASGRASNVSLQKSSGSQRLDKAATDWLGKQTFTPGTRNGQPVDMCRTFVYVWELR